MRCWTLSPPRREGPGRSSPGWTRRWQRSAAVGRRTLPDPPTRFVPGTQPATASRPWATRSAPWTAHRWPTARPTAGSGRCTTPRATGPRSAIVPRPAERERARRGGLSGDRDLALRGARAADSLRRWEQVAYADLANRLERAVR